MLDLSKEPVREVTKAQQLESRRMKPTSAQRGAITPAVRKRLKERSNGICERCNGRRAIHAAHITRRWKLKRTTVDDLLDLCGECHYWADNTADGRKWLEQHKAQ